MKAMRQFVELWYPRTDDPSRTPDHPTEVEVDLMDVRAADSILIDYDFERDGYRIRMATVHEWSLEDEDRDPKYVEVAFVPSRVNPPAWPSELPPKSPWDHVRDLAQDYNLPPAAREYLRKALEIVRLEAE